ncbi:MAG: alanine:cation symporter family protein [[Clostridium] leptum]
METNVRYLFRRKSAVTVYKLLVVVFVFLGSLFQADAVWALATCATA